MSSSFVPPSDAASFDGGAGPEGAVPAAVVTGPRRRHDRPLVYSCSGGSSAAQMTNWMAVRLDRSGRAEMSCIVGVGGDVPSLVRTATSGRPVIAIDGCVLDCVRRNLSRHEVTPAIHHRLSDSGIRKRKGVDFDPQEASEALEELRARIDADLPDTPE